MDRKEFLKQIGVGAAFVLTVPCLHSCKKKKDGIIPYTPAENVDFTIDLNAAEAQKLKFPDGFMTKNEVVIAKTKAGDYIAASVMCSDENLPGIVWDSTEWYCTEHDATYDQKGNGTTTYNDLGKRGIKIYNTELNGSLLRVYS